LAEDWPIFSLLTIIIVRLFQSQLAAFLPKALQDHFSNKARLEADQQEHEQTVRQAEMNLVKLKELSQLSSLSFTEEQLTQLTAETQVQLNEANSFVRGIISDKLDILLERIVGLKDAIGQVKDIQHFILQEMKRDGEKSVLDAQKINQETEAG
jgi:hypothetical protein